MVDFVRWSIRKRNQEVDEMKKMAWDKFAYTFYQLVVCVQPMENASVQSYTHDMQDYFHLDFQIKTYVRCDTLHYCFDIAYSCH